MMLLATILLFASAELELTDEQNELIEEIVEVFQGEVPRPPTPPTEAAA